MSKPVLFFVKSLSILQDCLRRFLHFSIGINLTSSQNGITLLKVIVDHSVREATHANPDAFKHTIASQLMQNEWRLHTTRLLVVIGHNATDEVRLSAVQGGHKSLKLDEVD